MILLARASALAVVVALLVAACSPSAPSDEPDDARPPAQPDAPDQVSDPRVGGTLRVGLSSDPATLDPRFVVDEVGELIIDALFDPLVRVGADGQPEPAAAERWEIDDSGREFRFHLRDAIFHDGAPVTAQDFVRSFDRIADGTAEPASFLAYLLDAVEGSEAAQSQGASLRGVEAVDERTLVIRLTEPDPGFLIALSDPSLVPLPVAADEDLPGFALQPVGNGPFAMAGPRELGAFVRLARFAGHRSPPLLDEVVFSIYTDPGGQDRQFDDLVDGQIHMADLAPTRRDEAIERFGESPDGYRGPGVIRGTTSTVYLYGLDVTAPPYDDPRIRRALSMAIDREALAADVMQGTRAPATSIVPPGLPGSRPGACVYCRHDPEAAAALLAEVRAEAAERRQAEAAQDDDAEDLAAEDVAAEGLVADDLPAGDGTDAEAGDTDGPVTEDADAVMEDAPPVLERLTLTHTRGDTHAAIAERMAADITSALDLDVDFQARDLQAFVQAVRVGTVPVFRLGWQVSTPDPGAYLRPLFHSSQVGGDNLTRFADDEVDALLDEARATVGERTRLATYRDAERRILDEMPVIPLLWYRHSVVVAPEVRDLVYSPLGRLNLDAVWFETAAE